MRYEWDERKNRLNQRKHGGISFELAALVFEDKHRLIGLNSVDETGEERWHAIGAVSVEPGVVGVLFVVHVYRHPSGKDLVPGLPREEEDHEEFIRIISARRANKDECRRYQEQELE
jgi:hypothetical protein